jgi:hypothetical protein
MKNWKLWAGIALIAVAYIGYKQYSGKQCTCSQSPAEGE